VNIEFQRRGSFFALALIVAGTFLFLDNLGILPVEDIGAYWPLALVLYGGMTLWYRRSVRAVIWSGSLVLAGVLLVLGNLHILRITVDGLWPLLLIALGATMLLDRTGWVPNFTPEQKQKWRAELWRRRQERWQRKSWHYGGSNFAENTSQTVPRDGHINEVAIFFGAKRRVESQDFQGGELVAVFGSIEIDLSLCTMQPAPTREAVLEASAVFGGIEILVPRTWRIVREGTGVFGSYEDKTFPRQEPGVEPSTLIIRGGAVFGSVTIRN
jgi:predicted membrane protein